MLRNSTNLKKSLLVLTIGCLTFIAQAQTTIVQVGEAFNEGVQLIKINGDMAVAAFEKAITLADAVGTEEAMQVKKDAMDQIPKLHYDAARGLAGKNDLPGAITKLEDCIKASEKYGNTDYPPRASKTLAQIYVAIGLGDLGNNNFDKAIGNFDSAISYDANYAKAFLGKVTAFESMNKLNEMAAAAELGTEAARASRDAKTGGDIQKVVRGAYYNAAQVALKDKNWSKAMDYLYLAEENGYTNSTLYYQLGFASYSMEKYEDAIGAFEQAATLEMGSAEDKAKIQFLLAKSYEATGNSDKACQAYKKSMVGEFAEAAKYQVETVLKCGN